MVNKKFIRCRKCDVVHHVTAFDKAPTYLLSAWGLSETAANDWEEFMTRHAGHRLEPFEASGKSFFPDGMNSDPMATPATLRLPMVTIRSSCGGYARVFKSLCATN